MRKGIGSWRRRGSNDRLVASLSRNKNHVLLVAGRFHMADEVDYFADARRQMRFLRNPQSYSGTEIAKSPPKPEAYTMFGLCGSIAREVARPGAPGTSLQLSPPSVVMIRPASVDA